MAQRSKIPKYPKRLMLNTIQLHCYYDRIGLPQVHRHDSETSPARSPKEGLELLTALQRYHLCAIPFENISLHYSAHHTLSIEPDALYNKIVKQEAGRGGYCMENNGLFLVVLLSLGFDVYPVGARINSALNGATDQTYSGWSHQISLVLFGHDKFMVDVGLGSSGPTKPILLSDASAMPTTNVAPQVMRLTKSPILDTISRFSPTQDLWVFSVQHDKTSEWMPCYCFGELEFLPEDFEIMNFYESTSRKSWFTHHVICARYFMEDDVVVGSRSLNGNVMKKRRHGSTESTVTFQCEEERVRALQREFGISLDEQDINGISGMVSALKGGT